MYNLPHFKEKDAGRVLEFVRTHPFALICGIDSTSRPVATQVPLFIEERNDRLYLSGHIMRGTDHCKAFEQHPAVLAVFTGAHSYVSASWYTNPQTASTWNYMSVHARGRLSYLDEAALMAVLRKTTDHFENNPRSPAGFDELPPDYVQKLSKAIVAFEIEVEAFDHVFKLSQNRDKESYHNIMNRLQEQGADGAVLAREMDLRKDELFNQ